jgi:CheY-like chemotaxis protein
MDDMDFFSHPQRLPTAERPLLGLTVLVVEDSRFASEALRLLCLRSGARIRRADCLRSARRHLQVYRPSVVIVDIGLRDGDGAELIGELAQTAPRLGAVIGMSGDLEMEQIALGAGADAFIAKPITSLGEFQELVLQILPDDRRPEGPRSVPQEEVKPDPIAYRDDLAHMADLMNASSDERTMDYIAQFLGGLANSADDPALAKAAHALRDKRANGGSTGSEIARIAGLVQERLDNKIAL